MDQDKEQFMMELLQQAIAYRFEDLKKYNSEGAENKFDVAFLSGYQTAVKTVLLMLDDNSPGDFIRNWANQFGVEGE